MVEKWDSRYPDPGRLRDEVGNMVEAFVNALLAKIPREEIAGIYFKGSAQKEWEAPLDYVPELSDVDLHLLFASDEAAGRYLRSAEEALEVQEEAEAAYFSKVPDPVHVPRPQLLLLNAVMNDEDFIQTPPEAVKVLYGEEYPQGEPADAERVRLLDAKRLRGQEEYLARFPVHVVDKPAQYNLAAMRGLVWRVSPTAPRALSVRGAPFNEVWTANRTRLLALLEERGEPELARHYGRFYLSGWDYFLSEYTDHGAGRGAVLAGVGVLRRGIEIANSAFPPEMVGGG